MAPEVDDVLSELKTAGTEQAQKTYRRHGVTDETYGVSYATFAKLTKKMKVNHDLAIDLWVSGVHDARVLSLMIADPMRGDVELLDTWVATLGNYVITDAFSTYAAKTPVALGRASVWIGDSGEWVSSAGWNVIGQLASSDSSIDDKIFERHVATIEREIGAAPNRTRHAMNGALIAVGARSPKLREAAQASASRIGKVVVDHGDTNCTTPDAISYIGKIVEQRAKKAAKAAQNARR